MPEEVRRVLLEIQAVIRAATVPSFVWDPKRVLSSYRVPQLPGLIYLVPHKAALFLLRPVVPHF